jgi:hypothetical protein
MFVDGHNLLCVSYVHHHRTFKKHHMKKYSIKEHMASPFDPQEQDQFLIGYLKDFDHHTMAFKITKSPLYASIMNLRQGALAVSKLNKLNMRFYELCAYEEIERIPDSPPE